MNKRTRILVFISCYLPGFKAGGPIRSVSGLIHVLGDELDFRVITLDRDLGDTKPYPGIVHNTWVPVGKAQVMYLAPETIRLDTLRRIIDETPHDVAYLCGGFDPVLVLRVLLLRRLGLVRMPSVLLAPQGVFSPGALHIKALKKRLFLALARRIGLYDNLTWHVSTKFEKADVRKALGLRGKMFSAVDISNIAAPDGASLPLQRRRSSNRLQVVFLSRISPKKNLDGAIRILQGVDVPVDFHIYGPAEDQKYWRRCQEEMAKLPPNVSVQYHGPVAHRDVVSVMRSHDLFLFPTHGENFGHVIVEALREGCPVLVADNTAFRGLEEAHAGWDLPVDDVEGFRRIVKMCAGMPQEQWLAWSEGARQLAAKTSANKDNTARFRLAFRQVAARGNAARAA